MIQHSNLGRAARAALPMIGIAAVLASAFVTVSCGNSKPKDGRTDTFNTGQITFMADESFYPIVDEVLDVFHTFNPQAYCKPVYTNELDAVNALMKGKTQLVITARDFSEKERKNLQDRGELPISIPFAHDGLALIVNRNNPDSIISTRDLAAVLNGQVSRWDKLYPGSKLGDIEVCFDNAKSATVHYCVDSLLNGKPINSPNIYAAKKSAEVIDFVEKTPNAIGIIGSNWLNDKRDTTNVTFKREIRVMGVSKMHPAKPYNSWKPYQYYLYNGNYPLVRTVYALLNDSHNGLPSGLGRFFRVPKGQLIVFHAGLMPVQGNINVREVVVADKE